MKGPPPLSSTATSSAGLHHLSPTPLNFPAQEENKGMLGHAIDVLVPGHFACRGIGCCIVPAVKQVKQHVMGKSVGTSGA